MNGANSYMKILLVALQEKILFRAIWSFWAWSKLSQAAVAIGSLNIQDMIAFVISTGSLNS